MIIKSVAVMVSLLALFVAPSAIYILPEGRQAIITQFGAPVGGEGARVDEPGIHFKVPFLHEVQFIEKRILLWDGAPSDIPTKDKKFIHVDAIARWKIVDPLKFIQTVKTEEGARDKLDSIFDGATRNIISSHNLVEAVRNSNQILEDNQEEKEVEDEQSVTEIEKIEVGREKLSQLIRDRASIGVKDLGIEVIDVQLRRVSYKKSVEEKVFERMISERQRIAEALRSQGRAERAKIEGKITKDLEEIESTAFEKTQAIRAKGQEQASLIYASAFAKDVKFYQFIKTMESFRNTLKDKKIILSTDNEYFKQLKGAD